jgi:methylmalonyl-CoA mutase
LQQLTEAGVDASEVATHQVQHGVSENYFMEIAKFRAARLLWAQNRQAVQSLLRLRMPDAHRAQTTSYNQTIFDPYVNLLRSETEAMSAALANVESLIVMPFNAVYETPDEFSERLARNQQLLLKEEAHFDKIVDVAGGSYYIEHLTEHRPAGMEALPRRGGRGRIPRTGPGRKDQDDVNATNKKRHDDAAKRKEFLLGTNQFPNFNETSEGKKLAASACGCGDTATSPISKLNTDRLAKEFEDLRLATEAAESSPWHSCSRSATWPCVRHAPSSPATSSPAPATR